MASPYVAGTLALIVQAHLGCTSAAPCSGLTDSDVTAATSALYDTVEDRGPIDIDFGRGVVDTWRAVSIADGALPDPLDNPFSLSTEYHEPTIAVHQLDPRRHAAAGVGAFGDHFGTSRKNLRFLVWRYLFPADHRIQRFRR